MFDTVLLRSLLAVADNGGFTRAAQRLHLTQSAISAHIRRLESEAGHKLLERTTRSVSLTPAGARLAGYARTILALHDDARASLGVGRRVSGMVFVGLSEEMVKAPIIDCLRRFSVAHPDVEVSLKVGLTGELLALVQSGGLDIVLGSRCGDEERGELLWSEPLVWARGPVALPTDDATTPIPLAVFSDQCPYRAAAIEALARAGRQWRIVCQSPSAGGLITAVSGGLGVTPVTRSSALTAGLQEVPTLPSLPQAQFILTSVAKPKRSVALLLAQLRQCASRGEL
ncbi:LysR family transcriptional regulator [Pseudomonas plecoglossicida]|uniref:LysR family transcriptional regulator n=1 Tax=Pseudomonas plecoglossicida TaxID=70775 RepID=A0ABX4U3P9_PSEDL|nr:MULTISPECIES: LysR family transcriptional regulator [Pseudomonas]AGA75913.1 LysR family transcriptional regulator [Pseudomonas putida HB3267]MCE0751510.1 LysR family transcriptional regulator [Pseudomonas asiatica]MCE0941662.1 LysR family transcriptional regulator [Pseudomonas asiatica]MCE0952777.1 LysR family transcriptional regulator [Pseudomonas asiatica]MCE1028150.1 LysR family transcriptional regulator [Pseudomonas asiatica]